MSPAAQEKARNPPRYTKRHASLESPREVPLPSPSENSSPFFLPSSSSIAVPPRSPLCYPDETAHYSSFRPNSPSSPINLHQDKSVIASRRQRLNNLRQTSLGPTSSPFSPEYTKETRAVEQPNSISQQHPSSPIPQVMSTTWLDRHSSASLPLPSQIPFYSLPTKATPTPSPLEPTSSNSSPHIPPAVPSLITSRSLLRCPPVDDTASRSSSSSDSSSSTNSLATTISSFNTDPHSSSSDKDPLAPLPSTSSADSMTRDDSRPPQRSISPFRAPQPPPVQPRPPPMAEWTAMRRFMTPSQLQNTAAISSVSAAMTMASAHAHVPSSSVSSTSSYPPPEPPTILPLDPGYDLTQASSRVQAPYVPFLSHAPPPADSWIEVETTQAEYKLHVRLPGFTREGITLATKRRRILHVVADSWENGGGHFERRIAFGYDADLVQVRAEFDGVMLRIVIPRRQSPISWNSPPPPRSEPMGRV